MSSIHAGIVLVSHSEKLAQGLAELIAQMAPDVPIIPAGGREDGSIGTSYEKVEQAVESLLKQGYEVIIHTDLGSATMTVDMVIEMHEDEPIRFIDAPFVETAIQSAVSAQQGAHYMDIGKEKEKEAQAEADYTRTAIITDPAGLHARPAAAIAEIAAQTHKPITINGVDADSLMLLMGLGLKKGEEIHITGSTEDKDSIEKIATLL